MTEMIYSSCRINEFRPIAVRIFNGRPVEYNISDNYDDPEFKANGFSAWVADDAWVPNLSEYFCIITEVGVYKWQSTFDTEDHDIVGIREYDGGALRLLQFYKIGTPEWVQQAINDLGRAE